MDRAQAVSLISASIAKGTGSPFVGVEDRDAAVEEAGRNLLSDVIEPYQVRVTSASFPEYDFEQFSSCSVYAIAGQADHLLLYCPSSGKFALGWGEDHQEIQMLGFATGDALAEWRG